MRREICGECGAPITDDGACDCTELLKRGELHKQQQRDEALLRQALEELKAENERLRGELERLRTDGASAVRWAPSSAYWSQVLRDLFGPDARKGIDALETRWQATAESVRSELHKQQQQQRDEALLRQALAALEQLATDTPWDLTGLQADAIAALRERLGEKP